MTTELIALQDVLRAIDDEPDLPGEIPEELWQAYRAADKETMIGMLRILVSLTKSGIRERLESARPEPQVEREPSDEQLLEIVRLALPHLPDMCADVELGRAMFQAVREVMGGEVGR